MSITTKGAVEIIADLKKINDTLAGPGAKTVVQAFGKAAVDHAKSIVPVDTGRLRDSIRFEMRDALSGIFSANTEYAVYVEMGTWKMSAQPYMRPSAEIGFRAMRDALNQILKSV